MTQFNATIDCDGNVVATAGGVTSNFTGGAQVTIHNETKTVLPGDVQTWTWNQPGLTEISWSYTLDAFNPATTGTTTVYPSESCETTTTPPPVVVTVTTVPGTTTTPATTTVTTAPPATVPHTVVTLPPTGANGHETHGLPMVGGGFLLVGAVLVAASARRWAHR